MLRLPDGFRWSLADQTGDHESGLEASGPVGAAPPA